MTDRLNSLGSVAGGVALHWMKNDNKGNRIQGVQLNSLYTK